jgi:PAS domain S-box-containing protein
LTGRRNSKKPIPKESVLPFRKGNASMDKVKDRASSGSNNAQEAFPDRFTARRTDGAYETQLLLAAIVDSSDDAIISKDLNGIILTWNPGAERLFGYTSKEVIGKSITLLIPQDQLDVELDILARLRKGERIAHVETLQRCKDGHLIDVSITASPLRNLQGEIIGASKVIRDITERRQAEKTQRESYARLQSHTEELAHFKQIAIERELRGIELKKEVNELSRRQGESDRYAPEFERQAKVVDDFEPAPVEYTALHPEGVPLESILCTEQLSRRPSRPPDYEAENRALAMLVQALADSPRTILQTLAETVRNVFKSDSAGLSLLTKDGRRFYWPAIAGMWKPHIGGGTPRDFGPCGDVLDCNAPLLFKRWDLRYPYLSTATPLAEEGLLIPFFVEGKAVGTIWAIAHNDHRKFDTEDLRLLESLGRFASAAYQAVEVKQAQESSRAALNMMEDAVQARKAMETLNTELRASEEALQVALRTRDEFMTIASHELKTPVTSVKMQLQMMRRAVKLEENITPPAEKMAKSLDLSVRQVDRLNELIEDLLDVTRIESGKMAYNFEPADLTAVVNEVIERFSEQIKAENCSLEVSASESVTVICDRFRIEQVVTNLITNAMKYGAKSLIKVELTATSAGASICVSDQGMGIAKGKQAKVFDRFERAITHNNISGLGLGLFISKQIVDAHGGALYLESELGRGSTFKVLLPCAPPDQGIKNKQVK